MEKGIWNLVPGRSPGGWLWACLSVSHIWPVSFSGFGQERMGFSHPEDAETVYWVFLVNGPPPFSWQLADLSL
jgi:hypothetical protein